MGLAISIASTSTSAEEILPLDLPPLQHLPAGEKRDSDKRTMGVVSMVMDHRAADDDVGQLTMPMEKNSRCKSYTPQRPARNGTPIKDDGGGLMAIPS